MRRGGFCWHFVEFFRPSWLLPDICWVSWPLIVFYVLFDYSSTLQQLLRRGLGQVWLSLIKGAGRVSRFLTVIDQLGLLPPLFYWSNFWTCLFFFFRPSKMMDFSLTSHREAITIKTRPEKLLENKLNGIDFMFKRHFREIRYKGKEVKWVFQFRDQMIFR